MRLSIIVCFLTAGSGTLSCLPDGIGESERKNLSSEAGIYPMGLWIVQHPAGYLLAALAQILLEEKLGYLLAQRGGSATPDAFFGLAGCSTPRDIESRGCGPTPTYNHVALEVWTEFYVDVWNGLKKEWPDILPERLGSIGYTGATSLYISSAVQEEAYQTEGLSLDFFREYNASWNNAAKYFASPLDIDTLRLLPCNATAMQLSMTSYLQVTGDVEGVEAMGNDTSAKCFDKHFWYPPSCRKNASQCGVMLTGGNGWSIPEFMQKFSAHNMPLAIAVAKSWEDYTKLPLEYKMGIYWWVPDPTFLSISPKKVSFPAFDRRAYLRGEFASEGAGVPVEKLVSRDLRKLAPDAVEFLNKLHIDIQDVEDMLRDHLISDASWYDVACQWLRNNAETWQQWIPDKSECFPQFGLYNEKEGQFVEDRSASSDLSCRACPSGRYSEELEDATGRTHRCRQCPVGRFQSFGAALACDPCPLGSYQDELGSASCKRCEEGSYQNITGSSGCLPCPDGTTTLGYSSISEADCGCNADTINTALEAEVIACASCGEGLHCPFGSSVESLRRGNSSSGSRFVASVLNGYFTRSEDPLHAYKCKPSAFCPGGVPGVCAGGLQGQPCAVCPAGQTWNGNLCQECGEVAIFLILGVLAFLVGLIVSYYLMNWTVSTEASPFQAALMAAGISVNVLQFVGIFGLMAVSWPNEFDKTTASLQFLILDVDSLGVSCVAGSGFQRLLFTALVFPSAFIWLLFVHALRRLMPRTHRWRLSWTMNTIGAVLQLGFSTMSSVAMQPFMCYKHPNGHHSLAKYSNIMCGSFEHTGMTFAGIGLILFVVAYMASCALASIKMPSWSLNNELTWVQSFRFLTAKFRMDAWFFGMLLPIRGLFLSLAIALATDVPSAQVTLGSLILLLYGALQMRCWPWKAEAINLLDMVSNAALLLMLGTSRAEGSDSLQDDFTHAFSLAVLLCLVSTFVACFATILAAFLHGRCVRGGTGRIWLNLGRGHDPAQVSHALTDCAEELLRLHSTDLQGRLRALNPYDLQAIASAITIVSLEVTRSHRSSDQRTLCKRIVLSSLNQRLSLQNTGMQAEQLAESGQNNAASMAEMNGMGGGNAALTIPEVQQGVEGHDEVSSRQSEEILPALVSEVLF